MIDDTSELASNDYILGETVKVHISLKSVEGKMFIDIRKWFKYPNLDHYVSSKKGIMLRVSDWDKIIPLINKLSGNSVA